jgi:hypothetical protein
MTTNRPSAGYKFNSFQEIKSHSSILYNERMAILFYMLDLQSINMNTTYNVDKIAEVRSLIKQIYKNVRMLIRNNPTMRASLNLDTQYDGVYTTDVASGIIDKMIEYCQQNGYTLRRIHILIDELNNLETLLKDILQYFHYFIRPDFRQKPDIDVATERYKEIADKRTVEELKDLVGKKHCIDFEGLGSSRIELQNDIEYDETIDGEEIKYDDTIDGEEVTKNTTNIEEVNDDANNE